jgi:type IV fimbrial biogenesis protein FimT
MKGFTLFEMMLVIVITVMVSLSALPLMSGYYEKHDTKIWVKQLRSMLKYARITALSHSTPVTIASVNNDWCVGIAVFKDPSKIGALTKQENLLRMANNPKHKACTIRWSSFPNRRYLRFLPSGMTDYQNGSFRIYSDGKLMSKLVVSQAGRVREE